ncbi:MAG: phosphoglycerate kinase [Desulfobacteraceae bacterium]|nr:MAG: phosphoglycerate kinase [Desulfobacteraceae bacterium]
MKSVKDIDVASRKVFVRVDYNLPMDDNLNITDDNRIVATLPLIKYLIGQRAKIILASHMGRPKGKKDPKLSLEPAARRLSDLLNQNVLFVKDCIGPEVEARVDALAEGQILLLENLRFYNEEKSNDEGFARKLAQLCDVYVNNAFAVSHREQASVTRIAGFAKESAAGFLLEKEVNSYYDSVQNPKKPLVAVIGGAKVSSKLAALENMLRVVDKMIIGGAMANTFLKSRGIDTKGSMIEDDLLDTAAAIVKEAAEKGVELLLPMDLVAAERFDMDARFQMVDVESIPEDWMALDIGPKTAEHFANAIADAGTIVWNGPMGVFEMDNFMAGTMKVAQAIADSAAFSIVGGGDTGLAAKKCGVSDRVSYISTGGGAFLHLMEGKELPGVTALE